ncbi:DUF4806 domain-containing protein, partial [Aphis craccivora]
MTPIKSIPSPVFIMTSPSGPWRVISQNNKKSHKNNTSDKSKTTNKLYLTEFNNKNLTVNDNSVKRKLQYPVKNQNMISVLCHSINENIEKMMTNASTSSILSDDVDIEALFPIKTSDDLLVLDNKIQDKDLRKSLVSKISLFVGKKDIRNSVRIIMARMFDDTFLVNYSLYGFKQKKSFSNLLCY